MNCHYRNIISLLSVFPLLGFAQITFENWYGGPFEDKGYSIVQTIDGGYIIAGLTGSIDTCDVYILKTTEYGDSSWCKIYNRYEINGALSIAQTLDGGYIIVGYTGTAPMTDEDIFLIRTGPNGDTLWTRSYGGNDIEYGYSVACTADGGYIITGETWSYGGGLSDVYLIKTNSSGDTLWTKTYGGTEQEWGSSVMQTADGGYIITGMSVSYGAGSHDMYLIKTYANGDTAWTRTFGGALSDLSYSVDQTGDGGYIIVGYSFSFGVGNGDVYLIRTNSSGDSIWTRTYGGSAFDMGHSVIQTTDGGYIITGGTNSYGAGIYDLYLIKVDSIGDTIWTKTYGGSAEDCGTAIAQTSDSGYIITGHTWSHGAGQSDVYLIKTDANGNVGIAEHDKQTIGSQVYNIFYSGTCNLPDNSRIFDLTGRQIHTLDPAPGVYFIEVDGKIRQKVIKIK